MTGAEDVGVLARGRPRVRDARRADMHPAFVPPAASLILLGDLQRQH
jgi:hypothetical protein